MDHKHQEQAPSNVESSELSVLSGEVRRSREREHEKIASRREKRATYDLPPELRAAFRSLSTELRIPASQLVSLALARFLKDYREGNVDLGLYKIPSCSPRYDWILELPDSLIKIKKANRGVNSLK